jgi:hypothetical protein
MTTKLNGKDFRKIGFDNNASCSVAITTAAKFFKHTNLEEILKYL